MKRSVLQSVFTLSFFLFSAAFLSAQINVYTEDFEGATLAVTSSSASGNNNNAWAINNNYSTSGTKSDSARVTTGDTLYLETNSFSTMGFSNVSLSFDQICKIDFFDRAFIEYSTDNGNSWTRLTNAEYNGSGFFTTSYFSSVSYNDWNPGNSNATPAGSWWKSESFDISSTAGNMQVKLRWMLVDADNNGAVGNYGWLIDDIIVTAAPCELIPPSISLTGTIYQGIVYSTGPYNINATITDASGVASATLTYTVNGGSPSNATMTNSSGTTWVGSIPAAVVGDTVCYTISATDNTTCGNVSAFPSLGCTEFIVANNPPPTCVGTPVFNFNYLESFASFTPGNGTNTVGTLQNNWVNDNNDTHDWWVLDRATTSGGTGPTQDNSPGDQNYMYVESSGSFANETAILNTPCFDLGNLLAPKFDFYYHMLGGQMGELHLDVFFGGQWVLDIMPAIIGNQGSNWNYRRVDLGPYAGNIIKLRFRAITGNGFASDIAIDDIEIIEPLTHDIALSNIFSPNANGCVGTANEFVTFQIASLGSLSIDTVPLAYRVNGGSVVRDTLFQTINEGDSVNFTFQQTVDMSTIGSYSFEFWTELASDQNTLNDSLLTFRLSTSSVNTVYPDSNDFDAFVVGVPGSFFDGWTNAPSGDTHDWYVNSGGTASNNTGPSGDTSSPAGTGNYLYVEATNFNNETAELFSKCYDINNLNRPELSFFYHMSGAFMGELHFDININGITIQDIAPAIIGDQGNRWIADTIDLTPYKGNVKLIFRAIVGPNFRSDIALDEVRVRDAQPVGINSLSGEQEVGGINVYPNPTNDQLFISFGDVDSKRVQIYNALGKVVYDATLSNSIEKIDVSDWSNGVYFLRSIGEQNQQIKFVVQ